MNAFCEAGYFFLGLKNREFGGLHDTRLDEMQAEFIFVGLCLRLDNKADYLFNLLDKAHQNTCVGDVEYSMESRKNKAQLGYVG